MDTRNSLFMNIGYDYSQYENNNYPVVFSQILMHKHIEEFLNFLMTTSMELF